MDICLNINTKPINKQVVKNISTISQSNEGSFKFEKKLKGDQNVSNRKNFAPKVSTNLQNNKNALSFTKELKNNRRHPKSVRVSDEKDDEKPRNKFQQNKFHKPQHQSYQIFSKEPKDLKIDDEIVPTTAEDVFGSEIISFADLGIHKFIVKILDGKGIKKATEIQQKAIPKIFQGQNLTIRSETGSGKTLAYALPIVQALSAITPKLTRLDGVQTLIIVPTRELALQTLEVFKELIYSFCWIVPGYVSGGESRKAEKIRLRKGLNILIGTPGRLIDHFLHSTNMKLEKIRCLVIDEADSLVEMGHKEDVKKLVTMIEEARNKSYDPMAMLRGKEPEASPDVDPMPLKALTSKNMQTIFLSATLTKKVEELKDLVLKNAECVESHGEQTLFSSETRNVTAPNVHQKYIVTDVKTRLVVLSSLLVGKLSEESFKIFIFMDTRPMVDFHEALFRRCLLKDTGDEDEPEDNPDVQLFKIHGDLEQKERSKTYKNFRKANRGILICTDAAARGIDVPEADLVVQYTVPLSTEVYVHRIGRTARAGRSGHSIILVTEPEMGYVAHLRNKLAINVARMTEEQALKSLPGKAGLAPTRDIRVAAEELQKRYEETIEGDRALFTLAATAYFSWYRYYRMFPGELRQFFDVKNIHQGHYVTSFGMHANLQELHEAVKQKSEGNEESQPEKRLNLKLSNNPEEERKERLQQFKRKKTRSSNFSEFDSGLTHSKKKKRKTDDDGS